MINYCFNCDAYSTDIHFWKNFVCFCNQVAYADNLMDVYDQLYNIWLKASAIKNAILVIAF